jgi:hypothetical protein
MLKLTDPVLLVGAWVIFTLGMSLIWWLRHRVNDQDDDPDL